MTSENEPFDQQGEEEGYDLIMPFVVVATHGGPFDDAAYVAGWEMGALDERLKAAKSANAAVPFALIHAENLPQLDLLLMKHNLRGDVLDDDAPEMAGWLRVELLGVPV